jgi:hypothetical protein
MHAFGCQDADLKIYASPLQKKKKKTFVSRVFSLSFMWTTIIFEKIYYTTGNRCFAVREGCTAKAPIGMAKTLSCEATRQSSHGKDRSGNAISAVRLGKIARQRLCHACLALP